MPFIRPIPAFSVLLIAAPLAWSASPRDNAEYLGGTVQTIPVKSAGTLDLSDQKELKFKYGSKAFQIPFNRVTGFTVSHGQADHRKIAHVRVPTLGGRAQILDLNFRDDSGKASTARFRLTGKLSSKAADLLSNRIEQKGTEATAVAAQKKTPEAWWGDNFWRTNRNKDKWPEPESDTVASAATGKR